MKIPRIIAHPVMGWYVIILLVTIAAILPTYWLISLSAAQLVSFAGTVIATIYALISVLWDFFVVRRRV